MMTAALISNKPEFVKLFLENGVRLKEFVTWNTLLCLYENLEPSCLFHSKLQKVLAEEHERLTYAPAKPQLHMHHVAQVLRELLGDSTQLLYPRPRYPDRPRLSLPMPHIKLNVSAGNVGSSDAGCWCQWCRDRLVLCNVWLPGGWPLCPQLGCELLQSLENELLDV